MIYYAKSADENGYQLTNREHLQAVADLAGRFGGEVNMPAAARAAGYLHDFGKYSRAFQDVLQGTASGIDHAICAAAFLYAAKAQTSMPYRRVAAVAAAHHSALRSYSALEPELYALCHGCGSGFCQSGKKAALFFVLLRRSSRTETSHFPMLFPSQGWTISSLLLTASLPFNCSLCFDASIVFPPACRRKIL